MRQRRADRDHLLPDWKNGARAIDDGQSGVDPGQVFGQALRPRQAFAGGVDTAEEQRTVGFGKLRELPSLVQFDYQRLESVELVKKLVRLKPAQLATSSTHAVFDDGFGILARQFPCHVGLTIDETKLLANGLDFRKVDR